MLKPTALTLLFDRLFTTRGLIANMIYLESPIGVGYSYTTEGSTNCSFGKGVKVNDNSTAEMNHLFLRRFFDAYPQFSTNDLYITGESYAGICKSKDCFISRIEHENLLCKTLKFVYRRCSDAG